MATEYSIDLTIEDDGSQLRLVCAEIFLAGMSRSMPSERKIQKRLGDDIEAFKGGIRLHAFVALCLHAAQHQNSTQPSRPLRGGVDSVAHLLYRLMRDSRPDWAYDLIDVKPESRKRQNSLVDRLIDACQPTPNSPEYQAQLAPRVPPSAIKIRLCRSDSTPSRLVHDARELEVLAQRYCEQISAERREKSAKRLKRSRSLYRSQERKFLYGNLLTRQSGSNVGEENHSLTDHNISSHVVGNQSTAASSPILNYAIACDAARVAADALQRKSDLPSATTEDIIAELNARLEQFMFARLGSPKSARPAAQRIGFLLRQHRPLPYYLPAKFNSELALYCDNYVGLEERKLPLAERAMGMRSGVESGTSQEARANSMVFVRHASLLIDVNPVASICLLWDFYKEALRTGDNFGAGNAAFTLLRHSFRGNQNIASLTLLDQFRDRLEQGTSFVRGMYLSIEAQLLHVDGRIGKAKETAKLACSRIIKAGISIPSFSNRKEQLVFQPDWLIGESLLGRLGHLVLSRDEIQDLAMSASIA